MFAYLAEQFNYLIADRKRRSTENFGLELVLSNTANLSHSSLLFDSFKIYFPAQDENLLLYNLKLLKKKKKLDVTDKNSQIGIGRF